MGDCSDEDGAGRPVSIAVTPRESVELRERSCAHSHPEPSPPVQEPPRVALDDVDGVQNSRTEIRVAVDAHV